jgi:hypothetical protein
MTTLPFQSTSTFPFDLLIFIFYFAPKNAFRIVNQLGIAQQFYIAVHTFDDIQTNLCVFINQAAFNTLWQATKLSVCD